MPISNERKVFLYREKRSLDAVRRLLRAVSEIEVAVSKMPQSATKGTMRYELSKTRKMLQKLERKHQVTTSKEIAKFADDKVLTSLLRSQLKLSLNIENSVDKLLSETTAYYDRVRELAKKK